MAFQKYPNDDVRARPRRFNRLVRNMRKAEAIASRLAAADRLYLDLKSRHPVFTKGCHTCEAIAAYEAAGKGDITDRETGDAETAGPSGWPRAPLNDKISLRDVRLVLALAALAILLTVLRITEALL